MSARPPVIAIDGPAASGKGTLALRLARHYGFAHLDTGSLYRAAAFRLLEAGRPASDTTAAEEAARSLQLAAIPDAALRSDEVGRLAGVIAAIPAVRAALLAYQRDFAAHPPGNAPGAVLDGRDVGTVICPDAPVKLFVTASLAARAMRRYQELIARGFAPTLEAVTADLAERDRRDMSRPIAPLKPAADAHLLDTTDLAIEAAFAAACAIIDRVLT